MLRDLIRRLLYASGAMSAYHRLRNADSLTVVMFHRTVPPGDPRWDTCDPDYNLRPDVLSRCLAFFAQHYNVVSAGDVAAARQGGRALPDRALLITFDDGWADNVDHALPALRALGQPALMFVVSDAIGRAQPFWQERLIAAWLRKAITVGELDTALAAEQDVAPEGIRGEGLDGLRGLIADIERVPPAIRNAVLARFEARLDDGLRHMVDVEGLRALQAGGVALGLHGKTHVHMTRAEDPRDELHGSRQALAGILGGAVPAPLCMSFPHGAFDSGLASQARDAGYELLFTSVPVLNPTKGGPGWLLGRTGFETDTVVDRNDRFRPDWLAWQLFRREARRLA